MHCKARLGRTGTFIALHLMWVCGFQIDAQATMGWLRIMRLKAVSAAGGGGPAPTASADPKADECGRTCWLAAAVAEGLQRRDVGRAYSASHAAAAAAFP